MEIEKLLNIRETFFIGEKYRLDFLWDDIEYKDNKLFLINARFTGPAMDDADKISDNDFIDLDFYKQYYAKIKSIYIVKLSWENVIYKGKDAHLSNCFLQHQDLHNAPKFNGGDYIVIDTKNHKDANTHKFNPTYEAITINSNGQLYNFFGNLL